MINEKEIQQIVKDSFAISRDSIDLLTTMDHMIFVDVVKEIIQSKGRLIVTGMGKSAIIGKKMVATMNSLGLSSIFLHPSDAMHGDMGVVRKEDVLFAISKSGTSSDVVKLCSYLISYGVQAIGLTSNALGFQNLKMKQIMVVPFHKEMDPMNLAPTASTLTHMAVCDALAIAIASTNNIKPSDFARNHPGGSLGKKLTLTIGQLVNQDPKNPIVHQSQSMVEVISVISKFRVGATAVVENQEVMGIITDGDVRRMLEKPGDFRSLKAEDVMTKNPKTISYQTLAVDALETMEENSISQLIVVKDKRYIGIIHMHEIVKEGISL